MQFEDALVDLAAVHLLVHETGGRLVGPSLAGIVRHAQLVLGHEPPRRWIERHVAVAQDPDLGTAHVLAGLERFPVLGMRLPEVLQAIPGDTEDCGSLVVRHVVHAALVHALQQALVGYVELWARLVNERLARLALAVRIGAG